MRIVTTINPQLTDPDQIADVARYFLRGVILANRMLIRAGKVPKLFNSGVRYRPEPWDKRCANKQCGARCKATAGRCPRCGGSDFDRVEEFADALTVLRRGWGDCDDLAPWRAAELQEDGDPRADCKVSWKTRCKNCGASADSNFPSCRRCGSQRRFRVFHVATRRGDGRVEDPSQYLGM